MGGLTEGVASNLTVVVSNATCLLNAWIDFNGDGDWNDAGEQIATNLSETVGSHSVSVTPPAASTQATTYARFRCSTQTGLTPTGAAADGEVEDYALTIAAGSAANDWGDAPDAGTGTEHGELSDGGAADNGAHHVMNSTVYLGACVDSDNGTLQNGAATADDGNTGATPYGTCATANDDEDGVTIPTLLAGQTALLGVSKTHPLRALVS